MSSQQTRRRATYTQLQILWEFLNVHRDIAVGYNKSAQARDHSKRMWERAAALMNSPGEGAIKSGPEWSKYWIDFKAKLKRKNRLIRDARSATGGGPSTEELSDIEHKFLQILGNDFGSGLPGVQVLPVVEELESTINLGSASQPSADGVEEPIYIDINFDDSDNNVESGLLNTVADAAPSLAAGSASAPSLVADSDSAPRLVSTPIVTPSVTPQELMENIPSRPATASSNTRQRRRVRERRLTAAEARERLVAASELRAQAEFTNSNNISKALNILSEIAETLKRMERKLPDAAPTND